MATTFKIDTDIPMPVRPAQNTASYPFKDLEIGQSFFVALKAGEMPLNAAAIRARTYWQHRLGTKYASRTVTEDGVKGLRFWRLS